MKLNVIHILLLMIIFVLGGVLFLNTKEKYEDTAKVVILNSRIPEPTAIYSTRENNIICDTSNPDFPLCLDIFKITHPRTPYNLI